MKLKEECCLKFPSAESFFSVHFADCFLSFQSLAIDMPPEDEESLETIEELRLRFGVLIFSCLSPVFIYGVLKCFFPLSVGYRLQFFHRHDFCYRLRLQEVEELYAAKCREGEVGDIFCIPEVSLSSSLFSLFKLTTNFSKR